MFYKEEEKRDLIMKHYSNPLHAGIIENKKTIKVFSDRCVDKTSVTFIKDGDIIKDFKHNSEGCAVFKSSIDIFSGIIINKTIEEIENIVIQYENMILGSNYDANILKELNIFDNAGKKLNRADCALLSSKSIRKSLL